MNRKNPSYQYQKITTTSKTVKVPQQNRITTQSRTVTTKTTTNSRITETKPKITVTELNSKNVQYARCNKCGKLKYSLNQKEIINETGGWSRKTDITKSVSKYDKYNQAAKTKCSVCGKIKTQCICGKDRKSTSVTTTVAKRSVNAGKIDLTPKFKINLDPEKIRKAVEEQKRINEEQKRQKESRTHKVEERVNRFTKEENYTYNKTSERRIRDEDLCHCGDENCKHEEDLMKKRREEELRRAKLMEEQRLKRIEEERIRKQKLEEEERRRKLEEERKKREEEEKRRRLEEERRRQEEERKRKLEEAKRKQEEEERRRKLEEERKRRQEEEERRRKEAERKRQEEERKRRLEEEKRRKLEEERREEENQKRIYEQLQFKDVPVKTFYMEYIQKRYKYADVPFPERSSYTVNITSDIVNTSSNMNMNVTNMTNINNNENILIQNAHSSSCQSEHLLCPGCGRMTLCQNKSNIQAMSQNDQNVQIEENQQQGQYIQNMTEVQQKEMICPECQNCSKCPGCGRMTYSENKSNIQTTSQNIAMKQEECICPDCQKCSGSDNAQTISQMLKLMFKIKMFKALKMNRMFL